MIEAGQARIEAYNRALDILLVDTDVVQTQKQIAPVSVGVCFEVALEVYGRA
jgi:hypothetical protein